MRTEFYNKLVCTEGLSKLDWLKWRQKGIGGSDIASVCGINPYHSGLALYYEKTEEIKEEKDEFKALEKEQVRMNHGNWCEPHLRELFPLWIKKNEGIDIEVKIMPYILQHPTNKIALANLDGLFIHPEKLGCAVEIKTTAEYHKKDWEEDNLPDYHYLQTQWYLYVTNYRYCYVVFLIGSDKFDVKIIERNEEVIKKLIEKANYFWNTFVIPKTPPAPDGTESSKDALAKLYPKEEEGKVINLNEGEIIACLGDIETYSQEAKELKIKIDLRKQIIKSKMGTAEVAICGDKKITWKEVIKKEYIVKESRSRQLRISKYKEEKE